MNLKTDIELIKREDLIPYQNNPKAHPEEQIKKIANSIQEFGFTVPLVVDQDNTIIAGHGRYKAAKLLDLDELPCIKRTDLTDAQIKAFRLADNRIAESEWEEDKLSIELEELNEMDFDLDLTGFGEEEISGFEDRNKEVEELNEDPIENKDLEDIKILNLYAGIGGNRKLWGNKPQVTAVEYNKEIARAYQDFFPEDKVIVEDAHEYLKEHYNEFDFIWSSPPCPTHSRMRKNFGNNKPIYPDMKLYEEILFLKGYFKGKWVVENVKSWYDPLIDPQERDRHYYWANFEIPEINLDIQEIDSIDRFDTDKESLKNHVKKFGISEENFDYIPNPSDYPRDKIIRNMVHPEIGKIILEAALNDR